MESTDLSVPVHVQQKSRESTPLLYSGNIKRSSSPSSSLSDMGDVELRTYWWRWWVLALFVVVLGFNNGLWITFSAVTDVMQCYYGVSDFWINSLSMIYMATYTVFLVPCVMFLTRAGLRTTFVASACFNAAGACLRWAGSGPSTFWLLLLGQGVTSLCNALVWGAPALVSSIWFPPSERGTATSFAAGVSPQLGILVMFAITPVIVRSGLTDTVCNTSSPAPVDSALYEEWSSEIQFRFSYFLLAQALVSLLLLIPALFAFPSAPPTPPSHSRQLEDSMTASHPSAITSTAQALLKNYHFLLFLITAGINIGAAGTVLTVANEVVLPSFKGYEEQIGFLGMTTEIVGIVALIVVGRLLDWTKAYYALTVFVYFGAAILLAALSASILFQRHFLVLYFMFGLNGAFITGYQAVAYEYAVEMTYPLPEGISGGLINWSSQVIAIVMIVVVGQVSPGNVPIGLWLITGLMFAGAVLSVITRPNLRRLKIDNPEKFSAKTGNMQQND